MTFNTGGSERVRIDTSGNVGIGTSSPDAILTVSKASTSTTIGGSTAITKVINSQSSALGETAGIEFFNRSTSGSAKLAGVYGVYTEFNSTGYGGALAFATEASGGTNVTERMRIDSSGNVGIGTSSPAHKLDVAGSLRLASVSDILANTTGAGSIAISAGTSYNAGGTIVFRGSTNATNSYGLEFNTNSTERMRITSGGEVYIAGTADQGAYNLQCNGTGVWGAGAYVNGSDARIKENIASIDSGLDVVNKLNPVTYTYKEDWSKDQSTQTGFIAQELLVALEGKNYVDGIVQQGGEYMSVAYQNIIPLLTKAIQELSAKVETLEAQLQGK
jgi:hypothetical protein